MLSYRQEEWSGASHSWASLSGLGHWTWMFIESAGYLIMWCTPFRMLAASTISSYTSKWSSFHRWCVEKNMDPVSCPLSYILSFLQMLMDRGLAFSTVDTCVAAISSCHEGSGDRTGFNHPLVKQFLKGVCRHRHIACTLAPQWNLTLALCALTKAPFETLDHVSLKFLSKIPLCY